MAGMQLALVSLCKPVAGIGAASMHIELVRMLVFCVHDRSQHIRVRGHIIGHARNNA